MKHDSTQPLWQPSIGRIDASNLKRFDEYLEHKLGVTFDDYQQLHQWSVEQPHLFWEHIWQFTGIRASQSWDSVLSDGEQFPGLFGLRARDLIMQKIYCAIAVTKSP